MQINRQNVLDLLDVDEPDYDVAAEFGGDAIPFLMDIVRFGDPLLAQKATALAAMIPSGESAGVIRLAAQRKEPAVRVAAAAALADLPTAHDLSYVIAPEAGQPLDDVLQALLVDEDEGVRRFAEQSAHARNDLGLNAGQRGDAGIERERET